MQGIGVEPRRTAYPQTALRVEAKGGDSVAVDASLRVDVVTAEFVRVLVEPVQPVFGSYPEVAFGIFGDAGDDVVADALRVVGMVPEDFEGVAVELVQSVARAEP